MTELHRRQFLDYGTYSESQPSRAKTGLKFASIPRPNRKETE